MKKNQVPVYRHARQGKFASILIRHSTICGVLAVLLILTIPASSCFANRISHLALPVMAEQNASAALEDSITASGTTESSTSVPSNLELSAQASCEDSSQTASSEYIPPPPPGEFPYQSLYPQLYCAPVTQTRKEKTMYLTFDDGPSDNTARILDTLKEKNVKATFFVIWHDGEQAKQSLKRIAKEGHTIAIHTYSHKYKDIYASVDAYLEDFNKMYSAVYEITGVKATLYRFPGGSVNDYNAKNRKAIINEMTRRGFFYFDWNISSGDGSSKDYTKQQIANNVLSTASGKERGVVLMHDSNNKTSTAEALPEIIDGLRADGYSFDKLTNTVAPICW